MGRSVVLELLRGGAQVVIIDNDPERGKWGEAPGIVALTADASKDETRRQARNRYGRTPYTYIGHRQAQSLLRPHVVSFLDVASAFGRTNLDLEIEQLRVAAGSALSSMTLEEAQLGRTHGVIVLAVRRPTGTMQFNPPADLRLEAGDVLIAMGERQKLKQLESELSGSATVV